MMLSDFILPSVLMCDPRSSLVSINHRKVLTRWRCVGSTMSHVKLLSVIPMRVVKEYQHGNTWKAVVLRRGFLFSIIPERRAFNNGLKLQEARFRLNIRKISLTVRAVWQWNQWPQELMSAPMLKSFKRKLDNHLSDLLWSRWWNRAESESMPLLAPSNSIIL